MTAEARADSPSAESQQQWRAIRAALKQHRHELSVAASALYPDVPRVAGTGLLCRPGWIPAAPIELDQVQLRWVDDPPVPSVTGSSVESMAVRPLTDGGGRFATYADAIGALDRPALFENRVTYRLLDADLSNPRSGLLTLTRSRYFDAIGVAEALAHEFAAVTRDQGPLRDLRQLPLRAAIGDPCDPSRRPASVAITTLTLRRNRNREASFLLHWRDPAQVTHAAGMYQVIPVGIFQPADENLASVRHDLNLWPSMVREFSEELLGKPENYSRFGSPVAYEHWDFYRRLTDARHAGRLKVRVLGVGVDPLTLVADVLTVAVFDSDLFDDVFDGLVADNSEGRVIRNQGTTGFALTDAAVARFADGREPMQAAGAAVLMLACKHQKHLLRSS